MNIVTYEIPYHMDKIQLVIPGQNVVYFGSVKTDKRIKDNITNLNESLNIHSLQQFVERRRVCLIVEDITREVPLEDLLIVTADPLKYASALMVLIATGTHDGETEGNYKIVDRIKKIAEKNNWNLESVRIHNCHSDKFIFAGETKTIGNRVYVNSDIEDTDVFVTFSDMKNHYFAGYSNALKNFLPGICAYETVERNHALALEDSATFGYHPLHPDKTRRENPLALDMWEGFQMIVSGRPVFVLATITQKNQILWSAAGNLTDVIPQGIRIVDRLMSLKIGVADYLIVSCGGYPNDESLYSAQRALELSKNAVKAGGEILFLAACSDGIGPQKSIENFYNPLTRPIDTILETKKAKYEMYSHKTYKFAQLIQRMNKIYVKSQLANEQISNIHLTPVEDAQTVINRWINQNKNCSINILTQGNKVAVHA